MSLKSDVKSVLVELSPILAGFKLALIVISYLGLGSVAKWVISYWYPFTRWAWGVLAATLLLPDFPNIVKDSLTALVFFLPLGITAIWQKLTGRNDSRNAHRLMGTAFGFLFLIIICKDVIASIGQSLASSAQSAQLAVMTAGFTDWINEWITVIGGIYFASLIFYGSILVLGKVPSLAGNAVLKLALAVDGEVRRHLIHNVGQNFRISLVILATASLTASIYFATKIESGMVAPVIGAILILSIILMSLLLAIFYAPRKLYVTTGAAIAFILAAATFELFVVTKIFMENTIAL